MGSLRFALGVFLLCNLTLLHTALAAYDDTPKCYRVLQEDFFDPRIVEQALSLQNVPQNTWPLIVRDLNRNSRDIPRIIRERSRRMDPNPLRKPFDPQAAERLLLDVLYDVFYDTLQGYDAGDRYSAREMFDYIKSQQRGYWQRCFAPVGD